MIQLPSSNGGVLLIDPAEVCAMHQIPNFVLYPGGEKEYSTTLVLRSGATLWTALELDEARARLGI